ncbi:MAG TPA: NAD(P)-dependent oxidoreductase [Phycisphaerae bacterium]|nr:NAD(P)-dependent oxidoreductase [Phycisphaerae bacterium]
MPSAGYPIFLNLANQPVLIVGGGDVGLRKARGLLETGAKITVISPAFTSEFADLMEVIKITEPYVQGWLNRPDSPRWRLVFAATDQPAVNEQVAVDAAAAGIFCCRCDSPNDTDFTGPAVHREGAITIAVSTAGASPRLSAQIVRSLSNHIDPVWADQAKFAQEWRLEIISHVHDPAVRRDLLEWLGSDDIQNILRSGGREAAEAMLHQRLNGTASAGLRRTTNKAKTLNVYFYPTIAVLFLIAVTLALTKYHIFSTSNPWVAVHVSTVLLGTACFAMGCIGGIIYLAANRRLKTPGRAARRIFILPSLERIEKINHYAIILGFLLLTASAIVGIFQAPAAMGAGWWHSPKVLLTLVIWLVYALLLNVRMAPVLRGARAAWLSILGFVLLLIVYAIMNWK